MYHRKIQEASLSGKKAVPSLEEMDRHIVEEIENLSFIREHRLVGADEAPKHRSIEIELCNGVLKFVKLPEPSGLLWLMASKDSLDFFTENPEDLKLIYPKHEFVEIPNPKIGAEYDLYGLLKDPVKSSVLGKKRMVFTNTLSSPNHFKEIKSSLIDIVLLNGGNLRIDLINLECKTLSFVYSEQFENALDIEVDKSPKSGDIFVKDVANGDIITHNALCQALKMQAEIGIVDRYEGRFYAHVTYIHCPEEFGFGEKRYVDYNKVQDISSMRRNIELLSHD